MNNMALFLNENYNPPKFYEPLKHTDVIVSNVVNLKANSTNPVLTRQSYNNKRNLSDRLEDYFDEYRKAVVTSSEVTYIKQRPKSSYRVFFDRTSRFFDIFFRYNRYMFY